LDRNTNKEIFEGQKKNLEFLDCIQILTAPIEVFYSLDNKSLDEIVSTVFKVSHNKDAKDLPCSYAFEPISPTSGAGSLFTTDVPF
jgi:hypothetical protein